MVGFEIITGLAAGHEDSASRCTRPMRPAPIIPTPMRLSSLAASFSDIPMSGARAMVARRRPNAAGPPAGPVSAPAARRVENNTAIAADAVGTVGSRQTE
eukprot:scaffold3265_cov117-Isochrysis_galbana.AAC.7